jgi:hypothetical protein
MPNATITVHEVRKGRLVIKLSLDATNPDSKANLVASAFVAWLSAKHNPQHQPAATSGSTPERKL